MNIMTYFEYIDIIDRIIIMELIDNKTIRNIKLLCTVYNLNIHYKNIEIIKEIPNVNLILNIKKLTVNNYNFTDEHLKHFKLIEYLDVDDNPNITTVNHLKNLKRLYAKGNSGINDNRIKDLEFIEELYVSNNPNITTVNHLKNLKILYAKCNSGINDNGI